MELNANRHSDAEQARPNDEDVQRHVSSFFYGEGGSEKPPLPGQTYLSGNESFDVTRRFAVVEGSRCVHDGKSSCSVCMVGARTTTG